MQPLGEMGEYQRGKKEILTNNGKQTRGRIYTDGRLEGVPHVSIRESSLMVIIIIIIIIILVHVAMSIIRYCNVPCQPQAWMF